MTQSKALTTTSPAALARPSFIPQNDTRGQESIDRKELILPRLALAQGLSPELVEGDPKYIDGLKNGDAFNSLTRQVYGKAPIRAVIVKAEKPRYIEFDPDNRGVILDGDVPADDERTQFTEGANGERVKPRATKFIEFVAIIGENREPVALSFKGSGLKTARTLLSLIALRVGLPAFATVFTLTPTLQKNDKGTFSVFSVKADGNVTEDDYKAASAFYESLSKTKVVVDRSDDEAEVKTEDAPF